MKRLAVIGTVMGLTVLGALAIRAQDEEAIPPGSATLPKRAARQVAEAYVAAVLAGKTRDVGTLLTTTGTHAAPYTSQEWLDNFRDKLGVESLEIESVRANEKQGVGVAVSKLFKLTKPHRNVGDTGCVVLQLQREGSQWRVRDMDIWSKDLSANALERFEKKRRNRSTDQMQKVEAAPTGEPSRSQTPTVGGGLFGRLSARSFFGSGGKQPRPTGPNRTPKYTSSGKIMVTWSEKGDAAWGFSKTTGNWTKQEIRPASKNELAPTVGDSVASLRIGQTVYAYSGPTGRWDILRLAVDQKPRVQVHLDMVLVTDGQTIYTFPGATGRWSSPDSPTPETSAEAPPERLDHLAQRLQQLEERSLDLARLFRQLKSVKNVDQQQLSELKGQLRKTVSEAFRVRQELQQAELEALRARLVRVQQLIETREGIEKKIIDRRVEELINRELSWDGVDAKEGPLSIHKKDASTIGGPPKNQPAF